MSTSTKLVFFFVAVATMVCFAAGSIEMAEGHSGGAAALFVLAILMTGAGFVAKARLRRK